MVSDNFHPVILNAGKAERLSDWNYKNVSSPFARIYLVTEGTASLRIGTNLTILSPGNLYLVPPFVSHDNICESPFTHYYLHFYQDGRSLFDTYKFPVGTKAESLDEMLFSRLVKTYPSLGLNEYDPATYNDSKTVFRNLSEELASGSEYQFETRACILGLMARFMKSAKLKEAARDRRILDTIDFICDNLGDPGLNVETLAGRACLSVNQFIRKFSEQTSSTPVQFITRKRIEKAQILLLEDGMENKAVSNSVGYEDAAYFCRVFKRLVGVSPQQYRESALKNI